MKRLLILVVVLAILFGVAVAAGNHFLSPIVITPEGKQQIVTRFGDVVDETEPGLSWKIPFLDEVKEFERRLLYLNTEQDVIQTKDQERIVVDNYAMWRITDLTAFIASFPRGVSQAERQMDRVVRAGVREVIARHTLTEVLTDKRTEIMEAIRNGVADSFAETGIAIHDVRINRTELPEAIEKSVHERMRADRERLARKFRAEGEEQARKIRASADRDARVIVANAKGEAQIARGEGDAESTRIYAAAFGEDPKFYAFTRSLEAYRNTIGEGTTLILSPNSEFFEFFIDSGVAVEGR
ncbi:MAG: protease modulator HflC [Deltaproteobacteria bacterium]|nr:protease modulator HflC [Deltaproteobacteria bacterium]